MDIFSEKIRIPQNFKSNPVFLQSAVGNWIMGYISTNKELLFQISEQKLGQSKISDRWKSRNSAIGEISGDVEVFSDVENFVLYYDNKGDLALFINRLNSEDFKALFSSLSSNYGRG